MKKTSQILLGRAQLGATSPAEKIAAVSGRAASVIPVQSIIHHFSVFGNYLNLY
jgi:hypothetical protein